MKINNKIIIGGIITSALALAPLVFAEDAIPTSSTGAPTQTENKARPQIPNAMRERSTRIMKSKANKIEKRDESTTAAAPDFATMKTNVSTEIASMQASIAAALDKLTAAKAAVDASTDAAILKKAQQLVRIAHVALEQALNGQQKPPMKGIMKKEDGGDKKDTTTTPIAPTIPATTPTGTQ